MKKLLTSLCLTAAVFSAVTATSPAHALDQVFNPDPSNRETLGSRLPPAPPPKAELIIQSWITVGPNNNFVYVMVKNIGKAHSGVFTTRVSIKNRFFPTFTVHDVKMFIPRGGYNIRRFPFPLGTTSASMVQSRAVADIENEVPEYNEENNRSLINLTQ